MHVNLLKLCPEEYSVRRLNREWVGTICKQLTASALPHQVVLPVLLDPGQCDNKDEVRFFYCFITAYSLTQFQM